MATEQQQKQADALLTIFLARYPTLSAAIHDLTSIRTFWGSWDEDEAAWALNHAVESTAELTPDEYEDPECRAVLEDE